MRHTKQAIMNQQHTPEPLGYAIFRDGEFIATEKSHAVALHWLDAEIVPLVSMKQLDDLMASLDVVCETQIVSNTYNRIREDRVFAVDDIEYDLFAAGWKAAITKVKGGA